MTQTTTIDALYIGSVQTPWPGRPTSAINKSETLARLTVSHTGFDRDRQADLSVHGGADKAIHHYAGDHYPAWQDELARPDLVPGSFGENISTKGLLETEVFIGDIFRLGEVLVQISQGRQPCWKLNAHTGQDRMAYNFQKTGRTGWYYRVLETGELQAGDEIHLVDRPCPNWSVATVTAARLTRKVTSQDAATLAQLDELSDDWRAAFAKMSVGNLDENTSARLEGSPT
ncbi:MOSC domain-containing protein [Epibacterium ulvae]|uniref:MOSC domain-containing protein n=1 Tax=Epibacterium ulvae TaxID=1156985 RepID=UPI001BFC2F34|nr:MOSC domain-containing protein [Epibacterium ulvae]MBT8153869.1 MOSC domain-containing protein [Epibacterium ulvae]